MAHLHLVASDPRCAKHQKSRENLESLSFAGLSLTTEKTNLDMQRMPQTASLSTLQCTCLHLEIRVATEKLRRNPAA